ncbi:hypothetical protein [Thermoanaerobacterium thermosaccharolyticum]|uniref:hypothetical protein n=1 Tax=Thermoanaerobacterium thermosaccharolyticum TaxID=1517 RepID=UPI002FDB1AEC
MGYKIINRKIDYQADHIIKKLGDFLLSDKKFLNIFTKIIIDEKRNLTEKHIKKLIQRYVDAMIISEYDSEIFLKLCDDFLCYDIRGNLLEYIVQKLGPFKLEGENCDYTCRTVIIYNEEKIGDADFDLVFFNKDFVEHTTKEYICIDKSGGEFIECKTDIKTFISEEISERSRKKLDFIKEVYNCFKQNSCSFFYIITFRREIAIFKNILEENNYGFINIIGGRELYDKISL